MISSFGATAAVARIVMSGEDPASSVSRTSRAVNADLPGRTGEAFAAPSAAGSGVTRVPSGRIAG
jgi:hypothetical protein